MRAVVAKMGRRMFLAEKGTVEKAKNQTELGRSNSTCWHFFSAHLPLGLAVWFEVSKKDLQVTVEPTPSEVVSHLQAKTNRFKGTKHGSNDQQDDQQK